MKTPFQHLRIDETIEGRVTVWIDVSERQVNVLFDEVFDELVAVLEAMACNESPLPLVFRSAKKKGFIVGADLKRIVAVQSDSEIQAFLLKGQTALEKLESYPGDTIAVIQGACLGGGLEFAMACRYRIASEAEATQLGMPEAKLGLIPGWGGTQRIIEIVGFCHGLELLLGGEAVSAHLALELQLVDALFHEMAIEDELSQFLGKVRLANGSRKRADQTDAATRKSFADEFQNRLTNTPFPQSQLAIFQAVIAGIDESRQAGLQAERTLFYPLLISPAVRDGLQRFANRPKPPQSG